MIAFSHSATGSIPFWVIFLQFCHLLPMDYLLVESLLFLLLCLCVIHNIDVLCCEYNTAVLLKKFAGEGERVDVQKLFGCIGLFTLLVLWWLGMIKLPARLFKFLSL